MSENSTQLAVILVREFFGPVAASLVDVLLRNGRLPIKAISRLAKLSDKCVAETLTVLMLHDLVRWVTVEEGTEERTMYDCLFEDIYPLVRAGTEIELAEKHAGSPEAARLIQFLLMQGRQRIKDVLASFSDSTAADCRSRVKTVQSALNTLLSQQYLRTVSWWNVIPADEFANKVLVEEEKKLRSERSTTSVSMTAKHQKEAAKKADIRISMMKIDERNMESLKRKVVDDVGPRKKRRVFIEDDDEDEERVVFDYDENTTIAVDHKKFAQIVRNEQLVFEVKKRLGPATASIYKVLLDEANTKLRNAKEDTEEIGVKTSEIALALPDPSKIKAFQELVDQAYQSRPKHLTNGLHMSSRQLSRVSDDEDTDMPELNVNGIDRNHDDYLRRKRKIVREHLQALADDTAVLVRKHIKADDRDVKQEDGVGFEQDEDWRINFRALREFVWISELEAIVEHKYGPDALRIVRVVVEKHHIDPEQFEKLILLKKDDIRTILPKLQIGGILETVEIPKTLERHRNIQLISFHESRARAFVLQDLYKTMVRIFQRLDEERQRRAGILKKAARTDVKKDLMRYLSPGEIRGYRQFKAIEERLLGQIMKVDQSVMLLRDI